jgi:hypothetical protein
MSTIHLRIRDELDLQFGILVNEKINRWLRNFSSDTIIPIDDCLGGKIAIGGQALSFEGTPRDVYWTSMHHCLTRIMGSVFDKFETEILKLPFSDREGHVAIVREHFKRFVARVYSRMVEVDAALLRKGDRKCYDPRTQIASAEAWINERTAALLRTAPAPPALTEANSKKQSNLPNTTTGLLKDIGVGLLVTVLGGIILASLGWIP